MLQQYLPFTVLKQCTSALHLALSKVSVATVLTVYGIETDFFPEKISPAELLQQYLPFTVLKPDVRCTFNYHLHWLLQQYLPFTVLKLDIEIFCIVSAIPCIVATVLTVYGIETVMLSILALRTSSMVATVLTVYGIETGIMSTLHLR